MTSKIPKLPTWDLQKIVEYTHKTCWNIMVNYDVSCDDDVTFISYQLFAKKIGLV